MDSALYKVRRLPMVGIVLGAVALGLTCYFIAPEFRHPGKLYIVAVAMAAVVPFGLWQLVTATDLAFDASGIRYKGKFVRWQQVRAIRVALTDTSTRAGIGSSSYHGQERIGDVDVSQRHTSVGTASLVSIPSTTSNDTLVIEWSGGKLNVSHRMLMLPPGGLIEIAQRMIDLQAKLLGTQGAARARLGLDQEEAPASPQPAAASVIMPARPTFGRKPA